MAQALALPKAEDIWNRAVPWLLSIERTDQANAFVMNRLVRDCEALAKTDAVKANLYLAAIYGIVGQREQSEYCLRVAEGNRKADLARCWRVLIYSNQLRASAATALADAAFAQRDEVRFVDLMTALSAVGAVHSIAKAADNAQMNQEVLANMTSLLAKNRLAAQVLDKLGLTQADVTALMDAAGEVLHDHHLQWLGDGPVFDVFDGAGDGDVHGLSWKFRVGVTPRESVALTDELIAKVIERDLKVDGLGVSFLGTKINESAAAHAVQ